MKSNIQIILNPGLSNEQAIPLAGGDLIRITDGTNNIDIDAASGKILGVKSLYAGVINLEPGDHSNSDLNKCIYVNAAGVLMFNDGTERPIVLG